jgi:hypothetical protein
MPEEIEISLKGVEALDLPVLATESKANGTQSRENKSKNEIAAIQKEL